DRARTGGDHRPRDRGGAARSPARAGAGSCADDPVARSGPAAGGADGDPAGGLARPGPHPHLHGGAEPVHPDLSLGAGRSRDRRAGHHLVGGRGVGHSTVRSGGSRRHRPHGASARRGRFHRAAVARGEGGDVPRCWSFSLPRGVTIILERALDWADVLLVIALLGPGPGGVYGVVTRIVQAGNMLEAALRIVLGPRISAAIARDDYARAEQLYRQATQLLIL